MAEQTSANSGTVAASSEEQSAGMNEINENAMSLSNLATDMMEIVKKFKI